MKISIIVATYNREQLLLRCINSLVNQKYPKDDYEIIIIDDASPVHMQNAIMMHKKYENIRYFRNKKNKGVSASRNTGIKHSRYPLLAFIDDDAIASRNWISKAAKLFENKEIGAAGNICYNIFYDDGQKKSLRNIEKLMRNKDRHKRVHEIRGYSLESYPGAGNLFIRKAILKKTGYFDESIKYNEDIDLCYRITNKGYRIFIDPALEVYHHTDPDLFRTFKKYFKYGIYNTLMLKRYHKRSTIIAIPLIGQNSVLKTTFTICLRLDLLKALLIGCTISSVLGSAIFLAALIYSIMKIKNLYEAVYYLFYNIFIDAGYLLGHIIGSFRYRVFYI